MRESGPKDGSRRGRGSSAPTVKSVVRAIRMLGLLVRRPQGMGLTEIAEALGLDRTTVHRLLRTLVRERVAAQDPDSRRYRFSPSAWLQLAPHLGGGRALSDEAQQIVSSLARGTGATCILSVVDETERAMTPLVHALSPRPFRFGPTPVPSAPAHTVAAGKCYLADLPEDELDEWLKGGLSRLTDRTITSVGKLREELACVRKQGYALSRGELALEVCGVAVPVRDDTGRVFRGIALATTERKLTQNLSKWLPILRSAADSISELLARGLAIVPTQDR